MMTKRHTENQLLRPKEINAAIAELQKIKAAVTELRSNVYEIEKSPYRDGRIRYLLRPLNKWAHQSNISTCRIHPWRRATEGRQCRLCARQTDMKGRWKSIRQALATSVVPLANLRHLSQL